MSQDTRPFRLAIAGLGTVGAGVVKIIQDHADLLAQRCDRPLEILAVSARSKGRDRGVDLSSYEWMDDPLTLAARDDVDAILEMIGGENGTAYELVKAALANGKAVITANKALLAHHGAELAALSEKNGAPLAYEAAVAGGIPVIKSVREGFAGNRIQAVSGILNGTCNYILSVMEETGRAFDDVLKEAQEAGYAEADPTLDIDGIDAAHKLCLLTALGFGVKPDFDKLPVSGIRHVTAGDIAHAAELGYRIKLLGQAWQDEDGRLFQIMEPCLVAKDSKMGGVGGVFNAVSLTGDFVDEALLVGRGAGAGPTASAVLSDIVDLARGESRPVFGVPSSELADAQWGNLGEIESRFYIHFTVRDRAGVMAQIAAALRDHDISIESLLQHGRDPEKSVSVILVTHMTSREAVDRALANLADSRDFTDAPRIMRIDG